MSNSRRTLYIGNLPFSACEADLREVCAAHGEIESVRLILDPRTGRFRGFGFAVFKDEEAASRALDALSRTELEGRPLRVNLAQPGRDEESGAAGGGTSGPVGLSIEPRRTGSVRFGSSSSDRARRRAHFASKILEERRAGNADPAP